MIQKNKAFNLGTFFCLYIAQTIPMSFFSTVIPVMIRPRLNAPGEWEEIGVEVPGLAGEFFLVRHRAITTDQAALDIEIPVVADGRPSCPDNGRL